MKLINKAKFFSVALSIMLLASGCFSSKKNGIHVSTVYPFEGRYGSDSEIIVNGEKTSIRKEDSIWILSNMTLFNLLTSVSDSEQKIVFGKEKTYTFNKSKRTCSETPTVRQLFDDEKYVWEKWTIPTNGVR